MHKPLIHQIDHSQKKAGFDGKIAVRAKSSSKLGE
jgi:hypothetical protein